MLRMLEAVRDGGRLRVRLRLPLDVTEVEIHLESTRNRTVSRYTDISPAEPPKVRRRRDENREVWYPVVDLAPEPDMQALLRFSNPEGGELVWNGMFRKACRPLAGEVLIGAGELEHWENTLWVRPACARLTEFTLVKRVKARSLLEHTFELLSPAWGGCVSVYQVAQDGARRLLDRAEVPCVFPEPEPGASSELTRENLLRSLRGLVGYTLRARNLKADSATGGGLQLFYDMDALTYRTSHWVWTWGVSINLLLRCIPLAGELGRSEAELLDAAKEIGLASLRFQERDPKHPARGVVMVRQDYWPDLLYHGNLSPADSLFLAGWGWIPLYERTGDERFLEASRALIEAIGRTNEQFPIVPQDYWSDEGCWAVHAINESGFGLEGLAEICRVLPEERYLEIARTYAKQHLDIFQNEDGLWNRWYLYDEKKVEPCNYWTRGMGWGMEGLLAANRLFPGEQFLHYAGKMAEHLMKWQQPAGCWSHQFTDTSGETGVCEKSTSLWGMLLYRLYEATGERRHLESARLALQWCLRQQYFGEDPQAHGGLPGCSMNSGVSYRAWFNLICSYSVAFMGQAILSELDAGGEKSGPAEKKGKRA